MIRANELADKLRHGEDLGFEKIIFCNIGNPQPLGQQPMTFLRQVLTLCDYPQVCPKTLHACIGGRKGGTCRHHGHDTLTNPQLMKDPKTAVHFPADVIDRAQELLADFPGGTGGYTDSRGSRLCRLMVASGIEARDGYAANPDDIWLTDGMCILGGG